MSLESKHDEIIVYVIENNQPWKNWTGIWMGYTSLEGTYGYYVKNSEDQPIQVDVKCVYEIDTDIPILKFLDVYYDYQSLKQFGLDKKDAELFLSLLNKMIISEEDKKSFYNTMDSEIPFEGGMGFSEALIGLRLSILNE